MGGLRRVVGVGAGFALYRFAATYLYGSGLGVHEESVGFVSDLTFSLIMNAASCLAAVACLVLLSVGCFRRDLASPWVASGVLLAGVVAGRLLSAWSVIPPVVASAVLGVLCGVGLFMLCIVWLDVLIAQQDASDALHQLLVGYTLYTVIVLACELLPNDVNSVLAAVALIASTLIGMRVRADTPDATAYGMSMPASERYAVVPVYTCFFVLVGVVGLMHTSVLGSSSEYLIGGVRMWFTRIVSLVLFLAIILLMGRHFNLGVVFKRVFPAFITVLTLLPFLGDMGHPFVGLAAILCYCVCAMLSNVFIVREGRRLCLSSALLACVYTLGSSGCLLVGLLTGMALSAVSASFGLSLLTLLAFVAIYPLVCVFVFLLRGGSGRDALHVSNAASLVAPSAKGSVPPALLGATRFPGAAEPLVADELLVARVTPPGVNVGAPDLADDTRTSVGELCVRVTTPDGEDISGAGQGDAGAVRITEGSRAANASGEALPPSREDFERAVDALARESSLTKREREILSYLALGRSVRYIAETLVISQNTAWTHVKRIYAKTKTHGKDELMALVEGQLG